MSNRKKGIQDQKGPMEGIRVIEYGVWHAGPGAGAILGDMGAEVIKIETPAGDPERQAKGLGGIKFKAPMGWSFLFEFSNRNKRGICLDIKNEKGREIFLSLLKNADVFITNLRKSTKSKLGIDYETLAKINPKIIYASVSGYGLEGPMNDVGAFDPLGQARSGMVYLTGSKEPVLLHAVILDQATAIACSHAILSGLLVRERQGIGQEVHVSLYSAALWIMQANLLSASLMDINPGIKWDRSKNTPLRNSFLCKDQKWIMGSNHREQEVWPVFCQLTGQADLIDDPRYADEDNRFEDSAELVSIFDKVFLTRTRDEWMELFLEHNLMFTSVQEIKEVLTDPQALANDYVSEFDHPLFGNVKLPGYPIQFSANKAGPRSIAPKLGEHTDEVMNELGLSTNEIKELKDSGVIR